MTQNSDYYSNDYGSEHPSRQTRRKSGLARLYDEQPLAVGAVTALIGATLALLAPTTRYEDDILGPRSDTFVQDAKQTARDIGSVAQESVRQAGETFKDEVAAMTPNREEMKGAARDLAESAKGAIKSSSKAAQKAAEQEAEKRELG